MRIIARIFSRKIARAHLRFSEIIKLILGGGSGVVDAVPVVYGAASFLRNSSRIYDRKFYQIMLIHQRIVRQTLLVLYFVLSYDGVQGEIKLSKLEDLELEKQLKLLNKPALKTIKTKYGDTYDCVDFYKQPAFDHPLLKNHNFHPKMKPTLAGTLQNSSTSSATNKLSSIWLEDSGCPSGTVPIKRITKNDLIRQKHIPPPEDIIFESPLNNAGNTHCFNTLCPGFVIVNTVVPIDMSFDSIQQRGDIKAWEISMFIERMIFTKLTNFANNVEWGGVSYSPPGVPESPMGSSCFPIGDLTYDAYCRRLNVLNDKGETIHIDKTNVRVSDPDHYGVMDVPHWRGGKYQHMVFYGGPGGFESLC
ncbi:hypothetical protein HAX54_044627 [Datura stramonium]|uniref:Neprosin PEP catalytic domain-containing protein n=1 Tax=Datura stramonium TaxID=4076 RepID=A0ABS8SQ04_DATST|nr:hypothetical protein [Datura stramonium]